MSNPEQQFDERGLRKSKRQRVPNQYYIAGISQLKKISLRGQTKKNRQNDDEDYSSDSDRNNLSNNYRNNDSHYNYHKFESQGKWLPCILPNKKSIKVQIVIDSYEVQEVKQKEQLVKQPSENFVIPSYNSGTIKRAEPSSLNLLSLFQQAIKNVADVAPSPVKNVASLTHPSNLEEPPLKYSQSNQKPAKMAVLAPPPKRLIEQDKDGKIICLMVDKQNKLIRINHSKMGQCQIPIQVEPRTWKEEIKEENSEQDLGKIEEYRKKIALNFSLLKSIPIFN